MTVYFGPFFDQFIYVCPIIFQFPLFDPIDPEFRPVVDSVLIPDTPRNLLLRGDFARVPFMTGTVKEEFGKWIIIHKAVRSRKISNPRDW